MSFSFVIFITHLLFFLASLADFFTAPDAKLTRARDVVSNATMADFSTTDAQDPAQYQMAVRGEITILFHRLRVSLLLLDTLIVRATADGGAELAGDPKIDIFTE